MERMAPVIQLDVPGPGGQAGFLLIAPHSEAIDWDIQNEIASTSRQWLEERQAWWVAAYYLPTARDIVHRFTPPVPEQARGPEPVAPVPAVPPSLWARLLALVRRSGPTGPSPRPPRPPEHPARRVPPWPVR